METVVRGDTLDRGDDGRLRCPWGSAPEVYRTYHDMEWGRPTVDDRRLFEKVVLEGFQAGLSWLTILRKREAFRSAFAGFEIETVAAFGQHDVERLLGDVGIVRHRGKIESAVNNARRALDVVEERGSLASYLWSFEPSASARPRRVTRDWLGSVPSTAESTALSRDLRRRGWTFVGPTTMYALMQAMGMVNDHQHACWVRGEVAAERAALVVPE